MFVCFFSQDALFNSLLDDPYLSLQLANKSNQQVCLQKNPIRPQ